MYGYVLYTTSMPKDHHSAMHCEHRLYVMRPNVEVLMNIDHNNVRHNSSTASHNLSTASQTITRGNINTQNRKTQRSLVFWPSSRLRPTCMTAGTITITSCRHLAQVIPEGQWYVLSISDVDPIRHAMLVLCHKSWYQNQTSEFVILNELYIGPQPLLLTANCKAPTVTTTTETLFS